jgi:hypothetical protein
LPLILLRHIHHSSSYNHVLAKHSWLSGGLLHRSVNRP